MPDGGAQRPDRRGVLAEPDQRPAVHDLRGHESGGVGREQGEGLLGQLAGLGEVGPAASGTPSSSRLSPSSAHSSPSRVAVAGDELVGVAVLGGRARRARRRRPCATSWARRW